ncbi:PPM-type phosphatase domain, Protein phosphatase 2C family [Artemisia annua]|uniref:PPM-type phosphatase domain, Protein phosphatase 2C family n=1 Tax=Artemisia annua TaxID=35608 RepID=A0A2U1NJB4_ARTAN|nr:PPM-type phosphatase domain, Protein phosphatase 2C family [Artemisia annua]
MFLQLRNNNPSTKIIVHFFREISFLSKRMIIASADVWDAMSAEAALACCRGLPQDHKLLMYEFI